MQLGQLDETFLRSRGCPWWPHYAIHFLPTVIVPYRQFVNECYHHHHLTGYMKISCHQSIILSTLEVRNHIFKCWKLSDCLPPPLTLVIWKKLHLWWPNKWYIRQRQRLYWYFHRFYQCNGCGHWSKPQKMCHEIFMLLADAFMRTWAPWPINENAIN